MPDTRSSTDTHGAKDRELADLARALGHPTRVAILRFLCQHGACICGDIVDHLPFAQATVSQHLKVLKQASLVSDEPEGTRRIYHVDPAGLGRIRQWLDRHWERALAAYVETVEREDQE